MITIKRHRLSVIANMTLGNTLIRGMTKHPAVELALVLAPIAAFIAFALTLLPL
jgi:hypothetical protein